MEYKTVMIPCDLWEALKIIAAQQREPLQAIHEKILRKALKSALPGTLRKPK